MSESPEEVASIALAAFADGDAGALLPHATASSIARWSRAWRHRIMATAHPEPVKHPPGMPPSVENFNAEQWTLMIAREADWVRETFGGVASLDALLELSDANLLAKAWSAIPQKMRTSRQLAGVVLDGDDTAYVLATLALRHVQEGPCVVRLVRGQNKWQIVIEREALYALPGLAGRTYNIGWLAPSADAGA